MWRGGDPRLRSAVLLLVLIAIFGYVIGTLTSAAPEPPATLSTQIPDTSILLEHPPDWRPSAPPAGDPAPAGLRQTLVLAPNRQSSRAALIAGLLSEPARGPLPTVLLVHLQDAPRAEVVLMIAGMQAYRYSHLRLSGTDAILTAYSMPVGRGQTLAVLCEDSSSSSSSSSAGATPRRECEQMVESLIPPQTEPEELTPYGRLVAALNATIPALEDQRSTIRAQMHATVTGPQLATLATRMSQAIASARHRLGEIPSLSTPVRRPDAELLESLVAAQAAYTSLSSAAGQGESPVYLAARAQVYAAEESLQSALNSLALLGY